MVEYWDWAFLGGGGLMVCSGVFDGCWEGRTGVVCPFFTRANEDGGCIVEMIFRAWRGGVVGGL